MIPDEIDAEPIFETPPRAVLGHAVVAALATSDETPEAQRLAHAAQQLVEQARAVVVTDPASYAVAGQLLDQLKQKRRDVVDWFQPMTDAAHLAWKTLTAKRAGLTDPLDEAIALIGGRYAGYAQEERARAEHERRELERQAQERERARLQAEADQREREAEQLRQHAATLEGAPDVAEAWRQQADALAVEAEETRLAAAHVEPPVMPTRSRIAGIKGPTVVANWTYEVVDKMALIKAVAAGVASPEALDASSTYLTKYASANKGTASLPGVRVYDAGSVRGTPRRGRR